MYQSKKELLFLNDVFVPPQDADNEKTHIEEDCGTVESAEENSASSNVVIIADEDNLRVSRQKPTTPKCS